MLFAFYRSSRRAGDTFRHLGQKAHRQLGRGNGEIATTATIKASVRKRRYIAGADPAFGFFLAPSSSQGKCDQRYFAAKDVIETGKLRTGR
jgi:hypothetical protein